jgi:chromosome segregation ATPase
MISNFSNFKVNEEEVSDSYVQELIDKISKLEEYKMNLDDRIDELEDDVYNLENSIEKKDEEIYGLQESFEKLEKWNSKLETEKESADKREEKLMDEIGAFEKQLKIYQNSDSVFSKGSEEDKNNIVSTFMDYLEAMEDYPLEFGNLIRENVKMRPKYNDLVHRMLNKEWLEGFIGSGSALLMRNRKK